MRKALAREQRQHQATREERDLLTALVTRNSVALGKPLNVLPKLILDEDGRVVNDIAVMARFEDGVKVGKLALIVPKTGAHLTYDLQIVTYEGGALEVFQLLNGAAPEQSKASRRSSFRYILVEHDTLLSDLFTRVVIIPRAPGQG
ncbi:MAG: hypothetical protein HOI95_05940 [Chromatiales bacterium]|nr:hypothetical protein [Chromatiales bacterium]